MVSARTDNGLFSGEAVQVAPVEVALGFNAGDSSSRSEPDQSREERQMFQYESAAAWP